MSHDRGFAGKPPKAEGKRYTSQNRLICRRDTACAAVLTENLFMDNEEACSLLLSERGRAVVTATHVNAIVYRH